MWPGNRHDPPSQPQTQAFSRIASQPSRRMRGTITNAAIRPRLAPREYLKRQGGKRHRRTERYCYISHPLPSSQKGKADYGTAKKNVPPNSDRVPTVRPVLVNSELPEIAAKILSESSRVRLLQFVFVGLRRYICRPQQ